MDFNSIFTLLASFGLSLSAGLRAYLPLLALGIASDVGPINGFKIKLTSEFSWLGNPLVIALFALLSIYEIAADKIPVVDHINDIVHTAIRPLSGAVLLAGTQNPLTTHGVGGLAFAAILGAGIAGTTHVAKSGTRVASTATTAGLANPLVSLIEDVLAVAAVILAVIAPVIGAIVFAILIFMVVRGINGLLKRRRARQAAVAGANGPTLPMGY
jgi:hypothetical protein